MVTETVSERCGGVVECCGGVATTQTWQRVVRGQWLVAALVKNNTERSVSLLLQELLADKWSSPRKFMQ